MSRLYKYQNNRMLTLNLPNKLLSAIDLFLSMSLKVGVNIIWLSNSLDPGETPSYLIYFSELVNMSNRLYFQSTLLLLFLYQCYV